MYLLLFLLIARGAFNANVILEQVARLHYRCMSSKMVESNIPIQRIERMTAKVIHRGSRLPHRYNGRLSSRHNGVRRSGL